MSSINSNSFDIDVIEPVHIFEFIRFIDQYPSTKLTIDLIEGNIVKYFYNHDIKYNQMMKEISIRYQLKMMFLHICSQRIL